MRGLIGSGAVAVALLAASMANATSVEIKNAVARVTVIPEARNDVAVAVVRDDPHHPLKVSTWPDGRTVVEGGYFGGFWGGITACNSHGGRPLVRIMGADTLGYDTMAQIVVRTPQDAKVSASGAVYGEVGRSQNLDLRVAGCGDWIVANVQDRMNLSSSGSGDVRTGSAGEATISTAGSGDVYTRAIGHGLNANIAGSSDIHIQEASGPVKVRISGSGDIGVGGGHASDIEVFIAGSGDLSYRGVADNLSAFIAGSGDVNVAKVTGSVKKSVAGSGDVNIGR